MLLHTIAEEKKPHTIAKTLVKPCFLDCAKIVLDDRAYNKLKLVPLSNNTSNNRIVKMSSNTKIQLTSAVTSSALPFAIQLDESTNVANLSQLLVYIRYVSGASIKKDFLFCRPLRTTAKVVMYSKWFLIFLKRII